MVSYTCLGDKSSRACHILYHFVQHRKIPTAFTQPSSCIRNTPHPAMITAWLSKPVDTQKPSFSNQGFVSIVFANSVTLLAARNALAFVAYELIHALPNNIAYIAASIGIFIIFFIQT